MLVAALEYGLLKNRPIYVGGFPGIGKSSVIKQLALKENMTEYVFRFGMNSPSEVGGIVVPDFKKKIVERLMAELVAKCWEIYRANEKVEGFAGVLLFLDEMDKAGKMLQNLGLEVVLDRMLGNHKLPPMTKIVLAGNVGRDGSGANSMSTALTNRCTYIMYDGPAPDEFIAFADPCPEIAHLVRADPTILHPANGSGFNASNMVNSTPRSLVAADEILKHFTTFTPVAELLLHGTVHPSHADQLISLRKLAGKLYSYEDIIKGKAVPFDGKERLPLSDMQCRALARGLKHQIDNDTNVDNVNMCIVAAVNYVTNIAPAEVNSAALRDLLVAATSREGGDMGATRVAAAFASTKADPTAYNNLQSRAMKAMMG